MEQMELGKAGSGDTLADSRDLARYEPQTAEGRYLKAIYLSAERTRRAQSTQTIFVFLVLLLVVVFAVGAATVAFRFAPEVENLVREVDTLTVQTNELVQSMSDTDFDGLVSAARDFVDSSSTSAAEALEKINSLDIDSLNESIRALSAIISPLSRLLGR